MEPILQSIEGREPQAERKPTNQVPQTQWPSELPINHHKRKNCVEGRRSSLALGHNQTPQALANLGPEPRRDPSLPSPSLLSLPPPKFTNSVTLKPGLAPRECLGLPLEPHTKQNISLRAVGSKPLIQIPAPRGESTRSKQTQEGREGGKEEGKKEVG